VPFGSFSPFALIALVGWGLAAILRELADQPSTACTGCIVELRQCSNTWRDLCHQPVVRAKSHVD